MNRIYKKIYSKIVVYGLVGFGIDDEVNKSDLKDFGRMKK